MNFGKRLIFLLIAILLCLPGFAGCAKSEAVTSSDGKYSLYLPASYDITDKELNSLSVLECANERKGLYAVMLEYDKAGFEDKNKFTEYFKEDLGYSYECEFTGQMQELTLNDAYEANNFDVTLKSEAKELYAQVYVIEANQAYVSLIFFSEKPLKDKTVNDFRSIASTFFEL